MMRNRMKRVGGLSLFALAMAACTPVNFFTTVKKTPKEYSRNYCCGEVAVPKSMDKRNPWIVYSDREQNATYYQPGGKVPLKHATFMEAFAVIAEKEDFLQLVKYKAEDFENGKIKDKSKVEYYGWMHKGNLLLSSCAVTDVATGYSIKMLTMIKDTLPLQKKEVFFSDKGVTLFQEPDLLTSIGSFPLHQPVFLLKKSADNSRCFVVGQERFSPETVGTLVAGWVSSSLVMPWGEYLYWNYANLGCRKFSFDKKPEAGFFPYMTALQKSQRLQGFDQLLPVLSIYSSTDRLVKVRTKYPIPMLDGSKNFVYALSGKRITRSDLQEIVRKRKSVNVMLAFSPELSVYEKMPQLVSSFQNLREVVAKYSPETKIRLGYCTTFYSDQSSGECALSENVDSVLTRMSSAFQGERSKARFSSEAFAPLKRSLDFFKGRGGESNLVVQVGKYSSSRPKDFNAFVDKLVDSNCRLVGFQHQSDQGNACNNYVLQLEEMIANSSKKLSQKKLDVLVHSDQLVSENQFREVQENAYALDFPQNSMWQGWLLFPKKKELLPCDMLVSVVDSVLGEMVADNADVTSRIQEAFKVSSGGHTTLASQWMDFVGASKGFKASGLNSQPLQSANPYTLFPMDLQVPNDSLFASDYYLFLTETELGRVRAFLDDVTKVRVDVKGKRSRNSKKVKSRTCLDMFEKTNVTDSVSYKMEYLNTSKARKAMRSAFYEWAADERVYPKKRGELKRLSLSQNQQEVFSMFSFSPMLNACTLGMLGSKKKLPDWELDEMQTYYLKKKQLLGEAVNSENRYEFNGQVYYLIKSDCLP